MYCTVTNLSKCMWLLIWNVFDIQDISEHVKVVVIFKNVENINMETVTYLNLLFINGDITSLLSWLFKINYNLIAVFYSDIFLGSVSDCNSVRLSFLNYYLQNNSVFIIEGDRTHEMGLFITIVTSSSVLYKLLSLTQDNVHSFIHSFNSDNWASTMCDVF